jgi:hypothetical protein
MIEKIGFDGVWTIQSKNVLTGEIKIVEYHNLITQGFYSGIHRFLSEDNLTVLNDELNITHLGMGDTITAATRADTTLANETLRNAITSKSFTDDAYSVTIFLDTTDGNVAGGFIKELGIFTKATATLDSGTMISRAVVDIKKNVNIQLTLNWEMRGTN